MVPAARTNQAAGAKRDDMGNLGKILLLPVVIFFATYWVCYDIFFWACMDERSPWTRRLGGKNPIEDGMEFARDLIHAWK